jgi:hypothetical protein
MAFLQIAVFALSIEQLATNSRPILTSTNGNAVVFATAL